MSARLFSPTSPFWRVNRELLVVLSGPRALLLELAHPLVAAGVADHSDFRRDPLGRLTRTLRVMTDLNFGSTGAARQAAQHTHHYHQHVRGKLAENVGPYLAGTRYQANDPLLKLWVLATLIDSTIQVYDLYVRPLPPAERQAYYADSQVLARAFGIPPELMPPTYADFLTYMDSMLASDLLTVGDTAREIVQALFAPRLRVLGPFVRAASFVSIGLLPERLRAAYGFAWDERREKWLQRLAAFSRRARPLVPDVLCAHPQAVRAEWRWQLEHYAHKPLT
ncbi:MAG: oxygenase MpaB family protein [Anaerolineales bacterium]